MVNLDRFETVTEGGGKEVVNMDRVTGSESVTDGVLKSVADLELDTVSDLETEGSLNLGSVYGNRRGGMRVSAS